jgi:hypothetical protein
MRCRQEAVVVLSDSKALIKGHVDRVKAGPQIIVDG